MRVQGPLVALGLWLSLTGASFAGIYNPAESKEITLVHKFLDSPGKPQFRDVLIALQMVPQDVLLTGFDHPLHMRYMLMDEMMKNYPLDKLKKPEDKLQASAALLRRGKFKEAELYLRPLAVREPENFLLQSHLASALHNQGKLQEAWDVLNEVLKRKKHWPEHWSDLSEEQREFLSKKLGWNEGPFTFYRTCELHYLKLLKQRFREQIAKKDKGELAPDVLFDDGKDPPTPVKFLNDTGEFEPGKIAASEKSKLPREAIEIVQQLLIWLPSDRRLYWQLGEIYSALGSRESIEAAHQIFKELHDEHERLTPNQPMPAALKTRYRALSGKMESFGTEDDRLLMGDLNKSENKTSDALPFDLRTLAVGFGAGFIIALFASWQIREIRRRRSARA